MRSAVSMPSGIAPAASKKAMRACPAPPALRCPATPPPRRSLPSQLRAVSTERDYSPREEGGWSREGQGGRGRGGGRGGRSFNNERSSGRGAGGGGGDRGGGGRGGGGGRFRGGGGRGGRGGGRGGGNFNNSFRDAPSSSSSSFSQLEPLLPPPRAWRLFNVSVGVADDPGKDDCETVCEALAAAAAAKLGCGKKVVKKSEQMLQLYNQRERERRPGAPLVARVEEERGAADAVPGGGDANGPLPLLPASAVKIVRKSFDARKLVDIGAGFVYVVDVDAAEAERAGARPRQRELSGKLERVEEGEEEEKGGGSSPLSPSSALGVAAATAEIVARIAAEAVAGDLLAPAPPPPVSSPSSAGADPIVVVGGGPAGLFAALALATSVARGGKGSLPRVVLLERGDPVETRGRSIGALFARSRLDPESNLCFGEGGAGTWSDGKLTTRIGRNDGAVRAVLSTLVAAGAPSSILVSGKPHLGTDRLVKVLRTLRGALIAAGVEVRFGAAVEGLVVDDGSSATSSSSSSSSSSSKSLAVKGVRLRDGSTIKASAVVMAPGHSARDTYRFLIQDAGVAAEAKPFALGFRVEHPQAFVDAAQYGELASQVLKGKGKVPVADYRLAAEVDTREEDRELSSKMTKVGEHGIEAAEPRAAAAAVAARSASASSSPSSSFSPSDASSSSRGVYSFCMCPGGQVVPTSTDPDELCVNGMSFSARGSRWANAALVVAVGPRDWGDLASEHGALAGVEMQRRAERVAARLGGGGGKGGSGLVCPVMRVDDYLEGSARRSGRRVVSPPLATSPAAPRPLLRSPALRPDSELPSSSYRLGVSSADLRDPDLYSTSVHAALSEALLRFDRQVAGFASGRAAAAALLHGVETRTSAPVRLTRDPQTCESVSVAGLFPAGEGAGYAGGIVSAAVDGLKVGEAVVAAVLSGAVTG